jgi:hypothetical protein
LAMSAKAYPLYAALHSTRHGHSVVSKGEKRHLRVLCLRRRTASRIFCCKRGLGYVVRHWPGGTSAPVRALTFHPIPHWLQVTEGDVTGGGILEEPTGAEKAGMARLRLSNNARIVSMPANLIISP